VVPIASAEHRTAARRPAYSVLDSTAIRDRFGLALPEWREQLELVLLDLHQGVRS
jgi:dTDP-4-dehydrorhamnose reductase